MSSCKSCLPLPASLRLDWHQNTGRLLKVLDRVGHKELFGGGRITAYREENTAYTGCRTHS